MNSGGKLWAVVPAAGAGVRMEAAKPKQYLVLDGQTVLEHTLDRLCAYPGIARVVVALRPGDPHWVRCRHSRDPAISIAAGGAERSHSVLNALALLAGFARPDDWVLVHDAARPCLRSGDIDRLVNDLLDYPGGGLLAVPVTDTVKRAGQDRAVRETVSREGLWRAYTPQMFRLAPLRRALSAAIAAGRDVTDEAQAMELMGVAPRLIEGSADNIKITRPEDLDLAAHFLQRQRQERVTQT